MDIDFDFPEQPERTIVETGMMKWAIKRLLQIHSFGAFCAWVGRAGIGKTTTAEEFVRLANEKYDPSNPRAFKAIHYEVGRSSDWSKHEMKRGIRSLYAAVGYRVDEGLYKRYLAEELAMDLVHYLKKMNIGVIFVDEAGTLPLNAIRGMVLVSDTARTMNWNLTIVLIGMDDLPNKLTRLPQIERRVVEWCYFKPYTLKETHALLSALHPFFAALTVEKPDEKKIIEYIHKAFSGLPGGIVPFVARFSGIYDEHPGEDPMTYIQAAHMQPLYDKKRSIDDNDGGYKQSIKTIIKDMPDDDPLENDEAEDSDGV